MACCCGGGGGSPLLLLLGESLLLRERGPRRGGEKSPFELLAQDNGVIPVIPDMPKLAAPLACCCCDQLGDGELPGNGCAAFASAINDIGGLRLSPERVVGGVSKLPEFTIEVSL